MYYSHVRHCLTSQAPPNYPEPYQSVAEITQLVNMAARTA
jgi:hypothetical protein